MDAAKDFAFSLVKECYNLLKPLYQDARDNENDLKSCQREYVVSLTYIFQERLNILVNDTSLFKNENSLEYDIYHSCKKLKTLMDAGEEAFNEGWGDDSMKRIQYNHQLDFLQVVLNKLSEIIDGFNVMK